MSSSTILDGVKFKLCDYLQVNKIVELPSDFDLKDPEVLLEDLEYNFSYEHHLTAGQSSQTKKLHLHQERRQLKQQNHGRDGTTTSSHTLSSPKPQPRVQHPYPIDQKDVVSFKGKRRGYDVGNSSSKNEILNDFTDLLTKDVIYTQDPPPTSSRKHMTRLKHLSPTHVDRPKLTPTSVCKSDVLDEFTDMLTDDVIYTQDSPTSSLKKKKTGDLYSESFGNTGLNHGRVSSRAIAQVNMEIERPSFETNDPSQSNLQNSSGWDTHVVLDNLTFSETSFVQSIMMMGFQEYEVIRTMQKYGTNQKEVLDHLFKVRSLLQKGYTIEHIEDALEFFNENEMEAERYLMLERQFGNMGFSGDKIKEALLLHDRDEAKVYEELMLTN